MRAQVGQHHADGARQRACKVRIARKGDGAGLRLGICLVGPVEVRQAEHAGGVECVAQEACCSDIVALGVELAYVVVPCADLTEIRVSRGSGSAEARPPEHLFPLSINPKPRTK